MKKPKEILNDLRRKLNAEPNPDKKLAELLEFVIIHGDSFGDEIVPFITEGIEMSKQRGFRAGEVLCTLNLVFFRTMTQGNDEYKRYFSEKLDLPAMVDGIKDDSYWYPLGLNLLSYFFWFRGEYEKGFNTVFEGIRINEKKTDISLAWQYYALAVFYFDTKDFDSSALYHEKALKIFRTFDYTYGMARAMNGLASVAIVRKNTGHAMELLSQAAAYYREHSHYSGLSRALNDMGLVEKTAQNYPKAIELLNESIQLRNEINHLQGLTTSLTELGEIYFLLKEYDHSLEKLNAALQYARQAASAQKEMRIQKLLYDIYKITGNTAPALQHLEMFYELRSKLLGDEAANNIRKLQSRFEKEKAEKETEIERLRNVELKKAYEEIEQKNKDIRDSINYARRIQSAILAHEEDIRRSFPQSYLLYKPKDIVAGDFYFFEITATHAFYAAADCTGHGVPGALVSVVCSNALTRCVREFDLTDAGQVLDKARELVLDTFGKSGTDVKDGMDISLLVKDLRNDHYYWAGANNPLWYTAGDKMQEIIASKQPIGLSDAPVPFVTHRVNVSKGEMLFLFTDGYADQFGGPRGKKFKYKQLSDALLANSTLPAEAQKEKLDVLFEEWKGDLEQVDDVCIVGIRI